MEIISASEFEHKHCFLCVPTLLGNHSIKQKKKLAVLASTGDK
jgi:hypothetical protein